MHVCRLRTATALIAINAAAVVGCRRGRSRIRLHVSPTGEVLPPSRRPPGCVILWTFHV